MSLHDDDTNDRDDDLDTTADDDGGGTGDGDDGMDNDAGAAAVAASLAGGGDGGGFVVESERRPANKGAMALFGLVLLAAGGFYYMYVRSGPQSATAAATAEAQKAQETITKFLDGGEQNMIAMQKLLRDTEAVVEQFLKNPAVKQVPLEALATNPFRFKLPKASDPTADEEAERKRREEERQAVLRAVQGLNLQTLISSGSRKACMINGTLFQEGQVVDGFTIERIEPSAVYVKNGAYRFELKMQK
jgi:hypothetical protein